MATPPPITPVQSFDQIVADLAPVFSGREAVIGKERAALTQKYDIQKQTLEANRVAGFDQINTNAVGKGMAFSGIPAHEQAKYLATQYLPGLQQADFNMNADDLALQMDLAGLAADKYKGAMEIRAGQQTKADDQLWKLYDYRWQAEQSAADRAFKASEGDKDRATSLAGARISAAGSGSGSASDPVLDTAALTASSKAAMKGQIGRDGKVSPTGYQRAREVWISGGGSADAFNQTFMGYVNQSHSQDYYGWAKPSN